MAPKAPDEAHAPPRQAPLFPTGITGLRHHWGRISEERNTRLKGRRAVKIYREMADNEATIGAAMRAGEDLACGVDWTMDANSGDPVALRALHIAETSLQDMDHTWMEFMSEAWTSTIFGHAYMEQWFKYRRGAHDLNIFRSKHDDGAVGIGNIALRAQESLDRWEIGREGEVLGMHQRDPMSGRREFIPMNRALLFRTKAVKGNPEGRSYLRNCYRSWFILKRLQEIEAIGLERDIAGYPDYQAPAEWFSVNATADEKTALDEIRKMVERIRADENAGVVRPSSKGTDGQPTGHDFSLISTGSRNASAFDVAIKRYESRILIVLMAEFLILGMDKVGSFALSSDKTHLFSVALRSWLQRVEDTLNLHAIPRLIQYNGLPLAASPTIRFGDVERADALQFAQALGTLISAGGLTPDASLERYTREFLDLPQEGDISDGQFQDAMGSRREQEQDDANVDDNTERALDSADPTTQQMELDLGIRSPDPEFISAHDAAVRVGVSPSVIMRAIANGRLPGAKIGRGYRIPREDFDRYMRGGRDAA